MTPKNNMCAIFWKPNIELGSETISSITIPISIQKNITTYIEGITSSGKINITESYFKNRLNKNSQQKMLGVFYS